MNINWKNVRAALFSIFVGACVAFISSFSDALVDWLQNHSQEIVSGLISTAICLAKFYRG